MILVVGAAASGKRTYVRSLGYDDAQMSTQIQDSCPVCIDLQDALRHGPLSEEAFAALLRKEVVVCCEVGSGIVPLSADERAWRELVGRTCSCLAESAQQVTRMVCGIPVSLKR